MARRPFKGHHHAAEVVNGKLYLFGGLGGSSQGKVQIYDPAANRWTLGASMPFAAGSASSAVIDGKVYVAGGIVGSSTTDRTARYDPVANTWTEIAPMPRGRNHAAAATDGNRLFVFGGRGPGSGDNNTVANGFDTVQIYNPATNTWQSSATTGSNLRPLPQARGGMGKAVYHDGEFHVLGGETASGAGASSDGVYRRVDVYNPATNTWRAGPPMPTARHGIFPLLLAGRISVAAGGTRAGASSSAVLEILNVPRRGKRRSAPEGLTAWASPLRGHSWRRPLVLTPFHALPTVKSTTDWGVAAPGQFESQLAARGTTSRRTRKTAKARQMICHGPCRFAAWFFALMWHGRLARDFIRTTGESPVPRGGR